MLKNFWWPIEIAHEVTNKPLSLTALGQKFVLWRDSKGEVHVLSDLCVHRGGSLAGGWLTPDSNSVVCPYHGWEFDGDGACTKIPAHPQRGIPKKARVDSYPVKERYGLVWAFLGDLAEEERPPLPDIPELEDPNYKRVYGSYYWDVNYERALENGMDPSHAPYVHGNRFGNLDKPDVADFEVQTTQWSGLAQIPLYAPVANPKGAWGRLFRRSAKDDAEAKERGELRLDTKAGYYFPNMNLLSVPLPFGTMYLFDAHVPISENRTRTIYVSLRSFLKGDWADKDTHRRVNYIFKQDDSVIGVQRPELIPFKLSDELPVRSDALQVAYRRRRAELIEKGWGIDMHQIVGDGPRDVAVVIPSPARKNNPELANAWVHKEVQSAQMLGYNRTFEGGTMVGDDASTSAALASDEEVSA
jgi:phenylpropionate dioxygenase-like ring-hydroxylating dioxygenase large terminal subunit